MSAKVFDPKTFGFEMLVLQFMSLINY